MKWTKWWLICKLKTNGIIWEANGRYGSSFFECKTGLGYDLDIGKIYANDEWWKESLRLVYFRECWQSQFSTTKK